MDSFENHFSKLGKFDKSLSDQFDLLNFSSLQAFPSYTLLKIWNNLPLEFKRSTSITMFKNKILKALFEKYLLKCNIDLTVSLVNNYINLLIHLYMLTSFGKIHENIVSNFIIKLLSMI